VSTRLPPEERVHLAAKTSICDFVYSWPPDRGLGFCPWLRRGFLAKPAVGAGGAGVPHARAGVDTTQSGLAPRARAAGPVFLFVLSRHV